MKFQFPKDEELYEDLLTVRKERSYEIESILDEPGDSTQTDFGDAFREVIGELRATKAPTLEARGSSVSEVESKLREKRNAHFQDRYEELESVAAKFAAKKKIGAFPETYMGTITYTDKHGDDTDYKLDYFSEMNKAFSFMEGVGWVGSFLANAKAELNTIKCKNPLLSGMGLFILFTGALVILAGASVFDFLPQIVAQWMDQYLLVRLAVLALMALTGWLLVMIGPPEEGFLFKFFANGIFLLIVALGSTLCAMRNAFSESTIEVIELLPFGAYYVLYSIFPIIGQIIAHFGMKKAKRQARKDFCARVEKNIQPMHRYIRFHVLWWQTQNPGESLPSGITNLQKSFDYLLKMYKKYD